MKSNEDFFEKIYQELQFLETLDKQNEARNSDFGQEWFRKRFVRLVQKLNLNR
jgi:hypothetical protein